MPIRRHGEVERVATPIWGITCAEKAFVKASLLMIARIGRVIASFSFPRMRGDFFGRESTMKLIIALAAAGLVSSLAAIAPTPAHAQKDPACMEKCNRENKAGAARITRLVMASEGPRLRNPQEIAA